MGCFGQNSRQLSPYGRDSPDGCGGSYFHHRVQQVYFLKYGFKQVEINDLGAKIDGLRSEFKTELSTQIDGLRTELKTEFSTKIDGLRTELKTEMDGLQTELTTIKTNHFGHLKSYLGVLNGVLLDRQIIDNETRARLDNEIRGM